jgi:hypothetical protein
MHNVVLSFCCALDSVILLSLLPSCFSSHFPCPCSSGSSCKQKAILLKKYYIIKKDNPRHRRSSEDASARSGVRASRQYCKRAIIQALSFESTRGNKNNGCSTPQTGIHTEALNRFISVPSNVTSLCFRWPGTGIAARRHGR